MPGGALCLARALTAQVLLEQQGCWPVLHIGVAKSEKGELQAHAWLEIDGQVVIGGLSDLARYQPLTTLSRIIV